MVFIRCDVSGTIGWGHLKRCLALADYLNEFASSCFLIAEFEQEALQLIKKIGSSCCILPEGLSYREEINYYPDSCRNIIIDLGHKKSLEKPEMFVDYLYALDKAGYQTVMLDGLGKESFRHDRAPKLKACIQPYWGVPKTYRPNAEFWFYGPKYVLLDKVYQNAYEKRDSDRIKKVLITFGGADPQENTLKVLKGLAKLTERLDFRVIIGPSFEARYVEQITQMCAGLSVQMIFSPQNLCKYYQWADLGICGSGMSRYEAFACGLPIMFASICREHDNLSRDFAAFGTAYYLGSDADLTPQDWAAAIVDMQASFAVYASMLVAIEKMQQSEAGGKYLARALKKVFGLCCKQ